MQSMQAVKMQSLNLILQELRILSLNAHPLLYGKHIYPLCNSFMMLA